MAVIRFPIEERRFIVGFVRWKIANRRAMEEADAHKRAERAARKAERARLIAVLRARVRQLAGQ